MGGAVKIAGGGQATVLHTTFEGNLARGGNGADGGPGQKGGDAGFGVAGAPRKCVLRLRWAVGLLDHDRGILHVPR